MQRQHLDLSVRPFGKFVDTVREVCGASPQWEPPRQVRYLRSYLQQPQLGPAQALVLERPYIDRHYLEEYTTYYARTLAPPPAHAARIHVFRAGFESQLEQILAQAAGGKHDDVEAKLNKVYLGYVTVRPIPGAPEGSPGLFLA